MPSPNARRRGRSSDNSLTASSSAATSQRGDPRVPAPGLPERARRAALGTVRPGPGRGARWWSPRPPVDRLRWRRPRRRARESSRATRSTNTSLMPSQVGRPQTRRRRTRRRGQHRHAVAHHLLGQGVRRTLHAAGGDATDDGTVTAAQHRHAGLARGRRARYPPRWPGLPGRPRSHQCRISDRTSRICHHLHELLQRDKRVTGEQPMQREYCGDDARLHGRTTGPSGVRVGPDDRPGQPRQPRRSAPPAAWPRRAPSRRRTRQPPHPEPDLADPTGR